MKTSSWVLSRRDTGEVICETYSPKIVAAANPDKVLVEPAHDYLCRLNEQVRQSQPPTHED